jgi:hypothetical protein
LVWINFIIAKLMVIWVFQPTIHTHELHSLLLC